MPIKDTRIRNWPEYNRALVQRGNITLWIDESVWQVSPEHQRGRPYQYSQALIESALTLKQLFHLNFRSLQGFLTSLTTLMKIAHKAPDYTTLCRRQASLSIRLKLPRTHESIDLVIDSTGLKVYGEGEWCVKKHGRHYQRTWRKVHLAVNANSLEIVSCELTHARTQDFDVLEDLLDSIPTSFKRIIGDGAYDQFKCYETLYRRRALGIFPPRSDARPSSETLGHKKQASLEAIAQRDAHIDKVRSLGREQWKVTSGYHQRSLAETTMYRLKQLLSDRLRARSLNFQKLELLIRCNILNNMIILGRPLREVF